MPYRTSRSFRAYIDRIRSVRHVLRTRFHRIVPAMFSMKVECRHEADGRVDDQDEEVNHCFEGAVKAQRDAGSRDCHIPQVLKHVLTITTQMTSALAQASYMWVYSCGTDVSIQQCGRSPVQTHLFEGVIAVVRLGPEVEDETQGVALDACLQRLMRASSVC